MYLFWCSVNYRLRNYCCKSREDWRQSCSMCHRAGPSLSAYNYDSAYGKRALMVMYRGIMEQVFAPRALSASFYSFPYLAPLLQATSESVILAKRLWLGCGWIVGFMKINYRFYTGCFASSTSRLFIR